MFFPVCCHLAIASFISILLESLARENGVLLSDRTTPCGSSSGRDADDDGRPPSGLVAVPRLRPQSGHHGRCDHGHVSAVLGAVLLRQYHRRLLQDLHTGYGVQGADVAGLLEFRLQPDHLFDIQHGVSGGFSAYTDRALPDLLLSWLPDGELQQFGHVGAEESPQRGLGRAAERDQI